MLKSGYNFQKIIFFSKTQKIYSLNIFLIYYMYSILKFLAYVYELSDLFGINNKLDLLPGGGGEGVLDI